MFSSRFQCRFAWQAWHLVTFSRDWKMSRVVWCGRPNTFASFSEDELDFSWHAQHFGDLPRHFKWQAQHFRRVLLLFFANRIVRAAWSGDNVQITWQAWDIVRMSFCVAKAVFGTDPLCVESPLVWLASISDTLQSTIYTPHSTRYTTLDTPHSTLHTLHSTIHT